MRQLARALDLHILRRYPSLQPDERDRTRNFVLLCCGLIVIFVSLGAVGFGRHDLHPPYYFAGMVGVLGLAILAVFSGRHQLGLYALLGVGGPATQFMYLWRTMHNASQADTLLQALLLVSVGNMLLNGYYARRLGHLHGLNAMSAGPALAGIVVVGVNAGSGFALHYVSLGTIVAVCMGLSYASFQVTERSARLSIQNAERRDRLQATTRNLEAILDSSGEAFLLLDQEGRIVTFNSIAAQQLPKVGIAPLRRGARLADLVGSEYRAETVDRLRAALRGESGSVDKRVCTAGHDVWVNVSCKPVPGPGGTSAGMCIAVADVTDRKMLESRLLASADQKETLLREVHHRVKNNFQLVLSLMSLQSDRFADSDERVVIAETGNRIRAMSAVHESLYRSSDLTTINMGHFIPQFVGQLLNAYRSVPCSVDLEVEPVNLSIERAVPCALILNELVTNALKYAFVDGRDGAIKIRLAGRDDSNGRVKMSAEDNGVGIPEHFCVDETDSLGMKLVRVLAGQLGGSVVIARRDDGGTRVDVEFPV